MSCHSSQCPGRLWAPPVLYPPPIRVWGWQGRAVGPGCFVYASKGLPRADGSAAVFAFTFQGKLEPPPPPQGPETWDARAGAWAGAPVREQ